MYCTYFGFTERPFNLTPNPAFIFLSRAHQEAFAHLIYGIENCCGFIMLTGEVGAGKTTVIRTLLTELKPETHATALILNPMVSTDGLLRAILREFGIEAANCNEAADMVEALNQFLLQQIAAGRKVVLVIDEAQDMEPSVLEQVRLISNLETTTDKLIQIILVGQPELEELMSRTNLRQLNQRITVRFHLTPMELPDTSDYIRHRIKTAAADNAAAAVFSDSAVKSIHRFSGGLPRLINAVADRALLIAFNQETKEITTQTVKKAIADITRSRKNGRDRRIQMVPAVLFVLCTVIIVLAGVYLLYRPVSTPAVVDTDTGKAALASLASVSETENQQAVLGALAGVWGSREPVTTTAAATLEQAVQNAGFTVHTHTGNFDAITRIGYPALLECLLPPANARRYVLLVAVTQGNVSVATAKGVTTNLSSTRLEQIWTRKALIPWKNHSGLPVPLRHDATPDQRKLLIQLMSAANAWPAGTTDDSYMTVRSAVRSFQARQGIDTTGVAGTQTLMQLYRLSQTAHTPSIKQMDR
jgi:general secretion pathway protein A